jgi:undecaprenyl diphosphate synthase
MQSTSLHVAIIMDGNGRWATERGLPRPAGHRAGAEAVRRVVEAAPGQGITVLTLYAFSSDNWHRPAAEVHGLLAVLGAYLASEARRCRDNGVRLSFVGRRDRFPGPLQQAIEEAERETRDGRQLHLRLALDYSARDQILRAVRLLDGRPVSRERFAGMLGTAGGGRPGGPAPDVDLLIRTGGERRLSDFMLWESAYAELVFLDCRWPDFTATDLADAVAGYHRRDRRFGRVSLGEA